MAIDVYVRTIEADALASLLASRRPAELPFAILERVDALSCPARSEVIDPTLWPSGIAFGRDLEIRWQQDGAGFRVLWAGAAPGAGWAMVLDLSGATASQRRTYLWGPDNVILAAAPALGALAPGAGRAQLVSVEYRRAEDHQLVWVRHVAFEREDV